MKKNILGAAVIFFVTLAFLLMLQDITANTDQEQQVKVKVIDAEKDSNLATTDIEEQEN